jgi:AcrR family transcriptional regulator
MRYPPGHKQDSRQKLVRAGAALAKRDGFAGSGVDALARAAGLTSGALYKHFEGKDALLGAICKTELETTRGWFAAIDPRSEEQVTHAIDAYLSIAHVRATAEGCVLPALAAEIGRAPESTRAVFERAFSELVSVVAEKVGDRTLASALVTHCVGAVTIARALATEEAQREVLDAAREGARRLLQRSE